MAPTLVGGIALGNRTVEWRKKAARGLFLMMIAQGWAEAGDSLSAKSDAWAKRWAEGDLPAVMAMYEEGAIFNSPIGKPWAGRAEIARAFGELLGKMRAEIVFTHARQGITGDFGYDSGSYHETFRDLTGNKPPGTGDGNFLILYHRDKMGGWKITEQFWTSYEPVKIP